MTAMDIVIKLNEKGYTVKKFCSEFGLEKIIVRHALTKMTIPGEKYTRAREMIAKALNDSPEKIWGKNFVKRQTRQDIFIEKIKNQSIKGEKEKQERIKKALEIKDFAPSLSWKQIGKKVGLSKFNIYLVSKEINKKIKSDLAQINPKEFKDSLSKAEITQAEMARRLGVSRQYINQIIQEGRIALWTRIGIAEILLGKQNNKKPQNHVGFVVKKAA